MVQKQAACDWSDLPIVLAVRRHGTLRGAAKALGVSHSTVLRRLEAFEASLGARVFERRADGTHELTPAGQDAFDTAEQLEELVTGLERRVHGRDLELAGPLRVTMSSLLLPVFVRDLAAFCQQYPRVDLSIVTSLEYLDLAHRESDVALRITGQPSPELIGRRLAEVQVGLYATASYLATRRARTPLEQHDFIGWDAALSHTAFARWIVQNVPKARVSCRLTQDWQIKDAVDAGLGVSLAPCALGDSQPEWRRVKLLRDVAAPLWLLSHRDLRASARMRVFREFLAEAVTAKRDLLEGRRPVRG